MDDLDQISKGVDGLFAADSDAGERRGVETESSRRERTVSVTRQSMASKLIPLTLHAEIGTGKYGEKHRLTNELAIGLQKEMHNLWLVYILTHNHGHDIRVCF